MPFAFLWLRLKRFISVTTVVSNETHYRILSNIGKYFSMSQKIKSMLEYQAHICWVITADYKVRLGQVKSEFDTKSPKLTRSVQASKLSIFTVNVP